MAERGHLDAQNPWPWLDPFTESASSFFNGRDDDVQALQRSLLTTPVCVFFGKSGLGKTSLLLAGLFPLLRERCLLPVPLRRVEHGAGTPALSSQLLRSLNDAVVQARLRSNTVDNSDTAAGDDVAALWERLHDRRQHLFDTTGRRWTIVFVLDQFEEIFTLQLDEHLRRQTFEQLGDLLENRVPPQVTARLDQHDELLDHLDLDGQPYRFLIALREDFLPELETWTDLIPRLGPNRYRLLPMSREQALDAVQKTGGELVDAPSAQRIVEFLGCQTAQSSAMRVARESRRIEPALLSLVCASLNADRLAKRPPGVQLDVSDLEARGAQILDRFYDQAFADLPGAQRISAASWIEANLITIDGTRRPYPLAAVDATLLPALRELVNRRLLRIEITEQGDQVELVHDRLATVALSRAQLAQQQAEATGRLQREKEAAELELFKQRAAAARLAEERADLERARAEEALAASRRTRRLLIGLMVLLVIAMGLLWWALTANEEARQALSVAKWETRNASAADSERASALEAATKALAAAQLLEDNKPDRAAEASALLSDANRSYQSVVQATTALQSCPAGRRLYPQVGSPAGSALVQRLAPALRAAGFIVPQTEVVAPERMPSANEIRYFHKAEEGGAEAAAAALAHAGLPDVPVKYMHGFEGSSAIRPCHYELWLAVNAGQKSYPPN